MIQRYCINYGELDKADFDGGLVMYDDHIAEVSKKVEELENFLNDASNYEDYYVGEYAYIRVESVLNKLKEIKEALK